MADEIKSIDNRTRQTSFKTPFPQTIAIHRAKTFDNTAPLLIKRACDKLGLPVPSFTMREGSMLIATVDIIDAGDPDYIRANHSEYDQAWILDDYGWCYVFRNARRFKEPVPYKGMQGFFKVPDELIEAALA